MRAGVVNVARWVRDSGFTNVVLEIANEFAHPGFDHPILKDPRVKPSSSTSSCGSSADVMGNSRPTTRACRLHPRHGNKWPRAVGWKETVDGESELRPTLKMVIESMVKPGSGER